MKLSLLILVFLSGLSGCVTTRPKGMDAHYEFFHNPNGIGTLPIKPGVSVSTFTIATKDEVVALEKRIEALEKNCDCEVTSEDMGLRMIPSGKP